MNKKKILLALPIDFELHNLIEKNLTYYGYEVTKIHPDNNNEKFKYTSLKDRIYNLFKKTFFKDKSFKKNLVRIFKINKLKEKITENSKYDFALFIRSDFFEIEIINFAKENSKKIFSYHYDGLNRNPKIFEYIPYFDKFYVFDKSDLENINYKMYPCTNFYFDYDNDKKLDVENKLDFYFLGSYHVSRTEELINFKNNVLKNYTVEFEIVVSKDDWNRINYLTKNSMKCSKKIIPFVDYLEKIKKSTTIIDFVINEHKGLSFRVFESMKYEKKLITNNVSIKNYDFYNPNNILIIENNNYQEIHNFINIPYEKINSKLYKKYSFENWINYLLEIQPNDALEIY